MPLCSIPGFRKFSRLALFAKPCYEAARRPARRKQSVLPGSSTACELHGWTRQLRRLCGGAASAVLLSTLAACGGGGDGQVTASPAATETRLSVAAVTTLPASYTVVNLGNGTPGKMNASGQVAFTAESTNQAAFYDGTSIVPLGTLGGSSSTANGLSNNGQVVGSSYSQNDQAQVRHAYLWSASTGMVDAGTLDARSGDATLVAVNDRGEAVGSASDRDGNLHGIYWSASTGLVDAGAVVDAGMVAQVTLLRDINSQGRAIGFSMNYAGYRHAFTWTPSEGMVDLDASGAPLGINSSGQIVGWYHGGQAFSWTRTGGFVNLGTLGGGDSIAWAINDAGQVTGQARTPDGGYPAFIWTAAGGMVNIGGLDLNWAQPMAINSSGTVVGYVQAAGNKQHAFAWSQADGMVDLNNRLANAPPGLELLIAYGVSDNGHILASSNAGLVVLKPPSTIPAAPTVGAITTSDPVPIGSPVDASVRFTDKDTGDTHTAVWSWGDGASTPATVTEANGSGSAKGTHTYSASGVYTVSIAVTDNTGKTTTVSSKVVVYDSSAGFVTGGGWIVSPAGAYRRDPNAVGQANFNFNSKYQKGTQQPRGTVELKLGTGNLAFTSDSQEWLVLGGARAQIKGTGKIDGSGNYNFMLTAVDGSLVAKGTPDRVRIKIWHTDAATNSDIVDYDNQTDTSTIDTNLEGTTLGGGSIVIHK